MYIGTDKNPHICQIETFDGKDISLNTNVIVNIIIISGKIMYLFINNL